MSKLKRLTTKIGLFMMSTAMVAGIVGLFGTAQPTSAMYIPARPNVCGSGYGLIDMYPIRVPKDTGSTRYGRPGTVTGYLYLYWNQRAMRNCAVAWGNGSNYGTSIHRLVGIGVTGANGVDDFDQGYFHYYAGPVYTRRQRPHQCVTAYSYFGPGAKGSNYWYGQVSVGGVHCG